MWKIKTTRKYKGKRYIIEGQENTIGKKNELTRTQKKKYKINIIMIEERNSTERKTKERMKRNVIVYEKRWTDRKQKQTEQ